MSDANGGPWSPGGMDDEDDFDTQDRAPSPPDSSQWPQQSAQSIAQPEAKRVTPLPRRRFRQFTGKGDDETGENPAVHEDDSDALPKLGDVALGSAEAEEDLDATRARSPQQDPERKRHFRRVITVLAVLAAIAAILVGWLLVQNANSRDHGPGNAVVDYLTLLNKGEATAAADAAGIKVSADTDVLLTDAAYSKAIGRPSSVQVVSEVINGKKATVSAQYTLGSEGERVVTTFTAVLSGDKDGLFFDKWELESVALPTLTVTSNHGGTLTVSGVDVTDKAVTEDNETTVALRAFPGTYSVAYTDPEGLFESIEGMSATVGSPNLSGVAALTTDVNDNSAADVKKKVEPKVKAAVDKCVSSKLLDSGCGKEVKAFGEQMKSKDVSSIKVARYPTVAVSYDEAAKRWAYTATNGKITVSGKGTNGKTVQSNIIYQAQGHVKVATGGKVTLVK